MLVFCLDILGRQGVELLDKIVAETLKEYANETNYIKIKGNKVKLTKKGLIECQKPKHEWD